MFGARYLREARPVEPISRMGATVAKISCSQCGRNEEWNIATGRPPPEALPKHFSNAGWITKRRPVCPQCRAKNEKENHMSNVQSIKKQPAPTDAVKAARRKANEFLMFHFDVEKGAFEGGWSDARVAEESGMPVAWVEKRREEEYGALKEPNEFADIRGEVKALSSEIGKLQSKLDAMSKRNGWAA